VLTLVGYLDRLSAAPGDEVAAKAGAYGARTYRADLRRIVQGDRSPVGAGYRDEPVALDLGGTRPARAQPIRPGSYVCIPDRGGVLASLRSFTLAAPIWPTRAGDAERVVLALAGAEVELSLDAAGRPMLKVGAASVVVSSPVRLRHWSILVASHDAEQRMLHLAVLDAVGGGQKTAESRSDPTWSTSGLSHALIAARAEGVGHFDGKIDSPVLFARVLAPSETLAGLADPVRLARRSDLVAHWDFARGIAGTAIIDASPHRLDGVVHQCPARAMTGWRWDGSCLDWTKRPDLYTAIHFHDDDLTDAGWDTDFTFRLPEDLRSGVYAVRLVPDKDADRAYHCVFAVRPPRDRATGNAVCFLLPTASYLAYANHRLGLDVPGTEIGMGRLIEIEPHHAFLQEHPELGFSFYEVHGDGSGVFHSSRNRPILDLQPGIKGFLGGLGSNLWQFNADTHLTGWLEHEGIGYDVITDEDLHREGLSLLRRYRVVLTGTHPEYHSLEMLDALQGFVDRGGRLMYLGGNGFYWRISFSDAHPGVIECRRSEAGIRPWEPGHGQFHHAFTGEYGGLWRRNGRPSGMLCGLVMSSQGFDLSEPYRLTDAVSDGRAAFIFEGLEATPGRAFGAFGLSGGGAAGLEIDRADTALGTPAHALVLARSERHTDIYLMTPEDMLDPTPDMSGTQSELVRADLLFFETSNGGAVFATGSIAWAGAMAWNGYANEVARLSLNVLRRFASPEPFSPHTAEA
jgi:N,N-dimethylformamidase